LEVPRQNLFVGVKSGKKYDKGYLVYLGEDIGCEDIICKLRVEEGQLPQVRHIIDSFIVALQSFKIGNVISVSFPEMDKCVLTKEVDHPLTKECRRKLPRKENGQPVNEGDG